MSTTAYTPLPIRLPELRDDEHGAYRLWTVDHGLPLSYFHAPSFATADGWQVQHQGRHALDGLVLGVTRPIGEQTPGRRDGQTVTQHHRLHGSTWNTAADANEALWYAGVFGVLVRERHMVLVSVWHRVGRGYQVRDRATVLNWCLPPAATAADALDVMVRLTSALPQADPAELDARLMPYRERGYRPLQPGDLVEYDGDLYEMADDTFEIIDDDAGPTWFEVRDNDRVDTGPAVEPLHPRPDHTAEGSGSEQTRPCRVIASVKVALVLQDGRWQIHPSELYGTPLQSDTIVCAGLHNDLADDGCVGNDALVPLPTLAECVGLLGKQVLETDSLLDGANGKLKTIFDRARHSENCSDLVLETLFGHRLPYAAADEPPF